MIKAEPPSQRMRCPHCRHLNSVSVVGTETTISFRCAACRKLVANVAASA
jgi:phage FluMu protein Com